ncbi:hypothetical protein FRB90_009546 [Tulasnella sp. 427]|nr:hypothetical protein FRB90_009546 [Tulasnella sp. 427]
MAPPARRETKTLKIGCGKILEVQLRGYADGLGSDDSMKSSSASDNEGPRVHQKGRIRRKSSRKDDLARVSSVKRKSSARRPLKSGTPGSSAVEENPIRRLLGFDFDIPAFYRKDKRSLPTEPTEPTVELEEIEDSEEYSDSEDDIRLKLRVSPRSKVKRSYALQSGDGRPRPIQPASPQRHNHIESLRQPGKRPSDDVPTETESESEAPVQAPLRKKSRVESPASTESEPEISLPSRLNLISESRGPLVQTAETESEASDPETSRTVLRPIDPLTDPQRPRPAFKPTPDQQLKGPLVLGLDSDGREISVPRSIAMYLRPYQEEGVRFFWERYKEGRGGVLGDDMGLGKTIQVISFLSAVLRKSGNISDSRRRYDWVNKFLDEHSREKLPQANANWPTFLIIAPKTVMGNWERELATWSYFEVGVFSGNLAQRSDALKSFKMGRYDILLTSHETARDNIGLLEALSLSCIFVDEAHKIKNSLSQTAKAYNLFQCEVRFGLTGTMIQNTYREMWPLLNWSNPGRVGTEKDWNRFIVRPMQEGQSKDATGQEVAESRELAKRFVEKLLPYFFLRRTKDLIKDQLPRKVDKVVFCPLTKTQTQVYERFLETEDVQLMLRKDEDCSCGSNKNPTGPDDSVDRIARNKALMKTAFPSGGAGTYATALSNKELCGKWEVLERLLHLWRSEKEEKNKVLIFSKSVKLLEFLSMWLEADGFNFRQLDGKVKQEDRFRLIDDFNLDPDVFIFLISTLTGGTGLNLVSANKLYKQQQMRIGYDGSHQTRLFAGVQGQKEKQGELFGIKNMLTLRKDLTTKEAIEDAHIENLDWALANTELATDGDELPNASQVENLLLEDSYTQQAEAKASRKGISGGDSIDELLNTVGIQYTHVNDHILRDNYIEATIAKKSREGRYKKRGPSRQDSTEDQSKANLMSWPPKRSHHTEEDAATRRLNSRKAAIIAGGHDLATFAQEFAAMPPDQQNLVLKELDAYIAANETQSF